MRNNIRSRINSGGALVILVILVVAMSIFAILAVQSSLNEKKLSTKTDESIRTYYRMDAEAERVYAKIDEIIKTSEDLTGDLAKLKELKDVKPDDGGVLVEVGDIKYEGDRPFLISYSVVKDERSLNVEVGVSGKETTINRWSTKTKSEDLQYELEITD